jgi:DNA-binding beta-propeller fold protein YncE
VAEFIYVTNQGSNNVSAYTIDATSGALTPVAGSPFGAGNGPNAVAVNANGTFAFVANQNYPNGSGSASVYTINATSGVLTPVTGSPFGDADGEPFGLAIDPTGKFAYVTNLFSNSVSAYTINATSGSLTEVAGSPFGTAGGNPEGVAVDPTGKFVYVPNSESNSVSAYTINATSGALTPVAGSPFRTGTTPQGVLNVAFDPAGKFAYVTNENAMTVSAYTINATSGALTPVAGSPFGTGNHPSAVAVDPTGKFAYVTNSSDGTVSAYTINATSGALTPVAGSPFGAGNGPGGVAVDLTGKFAYVTNSSDGTVSAYTINATSGALTQLAASPFVAGSGPFGIAVTAPPVSCISNENSLRSAIVNAVSGDTINVCAGTITLTGGELVIGTDLTITGRGAGVTTISGNNSSRVFFINPGASGATMPPSTRPTVRIANLTIANGNAGGGAGNEGIGGGGAGAGLGGGLLINGGVVTLNSVTFTGNGAIGGSGGFGLCNSGYFGGGGGGVGGPGSGTGGGPGGSFGGNGGDNGSPGGEGAGGGGWSSGYGSVGGSGGFGGGGAGSFVVSTGGNGGFGGGGGGSHGNPGASGGSFGGNGGPVSSGCGGGGGGAGLGGAIFIRSGTLSLINSIFTNNSAIGGNGGSSAGTSGTNGQGRGGAIFINDGAAANESGTTFTNNMASDGDNDVYGSPMQLVSVVSELTHGSAGPFDITLPFTGTPGVECRSSNALGNGNYEMIFTFSNALTSVDGASVTSGTGSVSTSMIGPNPNQYTVNLTGVSNQQYITITLHTVQDSAGNNGDVVGPQMGVLIGDTTANGTVNSSDIAQTQSQSGQPVTANNFREDVTVNGSINSSDIGLVQSKSGTALPTSP